MKPFTIEDVFQNMSKHSDIIIIGNDYDSLTITTKLSKTYYDSDEKDLSILYDIYIDNRKKIENIPYNKLTPLNELTTDIINKLSVDIMELTNYTIDGPDLDVFKRVIFKRRLNNTKLRLKDIKKQITKYF